MGYFRARIAFISCMALSGCGKPNTTSEVKIVNGQVVPANADTFKPVVALSNFDANKNCTATFITDQIALTAAHCVWNSEEKRVSPARRIAVESRIANRLVTVSEVVPHPAYRPGSPQADLAVLKMKDKIDLRQNLGSHAAFDAASIANPSRLYSIQKNLTIVGYGFESYEAEQNGVLSNKKRIGSVTFSAWRSNEKYIEIRSNTNAQMACLGDSGGPLLVPVGEHLYLEGVLSQTVTPPFRKPCSPSDTARYVSLWAHKDWIASEVRKLSAQN